MSRSLVLDDEDRVAEIAEPHLRLDESRMRSKTPTFDAIAGDVLEKQRVASGPRRTIPGSEAEAKAHAFVHRNAAFFDLTPPQAAQLVASAGPYPQALSDAGHPLFLVYVRGDVVQPGLEAFPNMTKRVSIAVTIFDDGEVGVIATSSGDIPELHLRTTPKVDARAAANAPRLLPRLRGRRSTKAACASRTSWIPTTDR